MSQLDSLLEHNRRFVAEKAFEPFTTSKYPERKLAILTCMDTRLVELLPKALGIRNGDVKMIKNAGALISHPWGSVMRSLIVAVYELNVEEICVIAHHDCGMRATKPQSILDKAHKKGIREETIQTLRDAGIELDQWLNGFDNVEDSVRHSVKTIQRHPLMPKNIPIHGLVIHPQTGELTVVVDGLST